MQLLCFANGIMLPFSANYIRHRRIRLALHSHTATCDGVYSPAISGLGVSSRTAKYSVLPVRLFHQWLILTAELILIYLFADVITELERERATWLLQAVVIVELGVGDVGTLEHHAVATIAEAVAHRHIV